MSIDIEKLKALALGVDPIYTDLYGDRYMQGSWSRVDLTKEQGDFIAEVTPAAVLDLIAEVERLRAAQPAPIRDWSEDFAHENGNYENLCSACRCVFYGHKRRSTCKACAAQPAPIPAQTGIAAGNALTVEWIAEQVLKFRGTERLTPFGIETAYRCARVIHRVAERHIAAHATPCAGNALTEEAMDAARWRRWAPYLGRTLKRLPFELARDLAATQSNEPTGDSNA